MASELPRMMRADVQFQIYRLEQMAMGGALAFDADELRSACHLIRTLATEIDRAPVQASEARGWRLVPEVPTQAMLDSFSDPDLPGDDAWVRECWIAMLNAAPAHTQAGPVADVYDAMGERLKEPKRQQ